MSFFVRPKYHSNRRSQKFSVTTTSNARTHEQLTVAHAFVPEGEPGDRLNFIRGDTSLPPPSDRADGRRRRRGGGASAYTNYKYLARGVRAGLFGPLLLLRIADYVSISSNSRDVETELPRSEGWKGAAAGVPSLSPASAPPAVTHALAV